MKRSKRIQALDKRPVNMDGFIDEWPQMGFSAMNSPFDPSPSVKTKNGRIIELDGKKQEDFDFIDQFIADYAVNIERTEKSMKVSSLDIARMIVDIHVPRKEILEVVSGITPAKMVEVLNHLNVVELMMGMQKMRARRTPGNQAHITNLKDDPVQIAADAAEGALRGFAEEETTMGVARYAPLSAMALLIGSQAGRPGVLTQCSAEEATELELGIRGLTTYAETLSVYGTEKVFIDGDDTPYSKAFLNSAYASRGLKVRFTSGSGSEVLMGNSEKKSMLYLECRCLYATKGAGSQGIQNGSVSCIGVPGSVPGGIREVMSENLVAALLGLECASSNDQSFSNSDMRRTARTMLQFLPGTDFIFSGYAAEPNYDNMFAGSNFDAEDFDDYNVLQRDMQVDGGLRPVTEEEVIAVRRKAAVAVQAVFSQLGLSPVSNEQVEAVVYAHGSKDTLKRDVTADLIAAEDVLKRGITGVDVVKALAEAGHRDIAENVLNMLKQRVAGDYMQTAAILDKDFHVLSGVNTPNDYMGPGTGYRVEGDRWEEIKKIPHNYSTQGSAAGNTVQINEELIKQITHAVLMEVGSKKDGSENTPPVDAQIPTDHRDRVNKVKTSYASYTKAKRGTDPKEVVIGVGAAFQKEISNTICDLPLKDVLSNIKAGIEEEGMEWRVVKILDTSDVCFMALEAAKLSGSGIGIGLQSKGTAVIHQKDLYPLSNLELFPQAPLMTLEAYRQIGQNAAKYVKGEQVIPVPCTNDPMSRPKYQVKAALMHIAETEQLDPALGIIEWEGK